MTVRLHSAGGQENVLEYRSGACHGWALLMLPDLGGGSTADAKPVFTLIGEKEAQDLIAEHGLVEMG